MPWTKYQMPKIDGLFDGKAMTREASATVIGGTTVDAANLPVKIRPLATGAVAKIPVVLAELTVQINVNSIISLPEAALEIKDIKKHLKITQCLLLQNTNMLFIKGFIRKNIQYATRKSSNKDAVCGDIKHCTVDTPFSCTTPITYNGIAPLPPIPSESTEFRYFRKQDVSGPDFADKDHLLSSDLSEFNQISTEYYNELPYCELISSRIVEFDEYLNPTVPKRGILPFEEREFKRIEEKAVIYLTLKLLQKRQVAVPPLIPAADHGCYSSMSEEE
ncbi:MAG: CsxC family protein [Thermotaleaceae bacterium]